MEINVNANETATLHRQMSSAGGVAGRQRSELAEREREAVSAGLKEQRFRRF